MTDKIISWATDTHFDRANDKKAIDTLCDNIAEQSDYLFLTGDIGAGQELRQILDELAAKTRTPIMFVLGNHDHWGKEINAAKDVAAKTAESSSGALCYLSVSTPVFIDRQTAVIGHDGWYDALHGDWMSSSKPMGDWQNIRDFSLAFGDMSVIAAASRRFANDAVAHVVASAKTAVASGAKTIYVLTHVPPWRQLVSFGGRLSEECVPWYTSKLMGDALDALADANRHTDFKILCGHTHEERVIMRKNNMRAFSGKSQRSIPSTCGRFVCRHVPE